MVIKDKIIKVTDAVNYKVNNPGQYIVNYLATNLAMWILICLKQRLTSRKVLSRMYWLIHKLTYAFIIVAKF